MDDTLATQQKMARFASPLVGERSPKRSRKSLEPEDAENAQTVIEIIEDGDALLLVSGSSTMPDTQIALLVSSFALSMASSVLKAQLASATQSHEEQPKTVLALPDTDGDAALIVCNIIHLRNDKLPAHVPAEQLHQIALFAEKYKCKVGIGRSTTQWFDRLYHMANSSQADLCKVIEAAYLLDEAVWFARFTSRWVLKTSLLAPQLPSMHSIESAKLALTLGSQQTSSHTRLRMDLDSVVDVAVRCFSREYKHYIDWAPEMSPDPSETPSGKEPVRCRVDGDGGQEFLGALREARIWPSAAWFRAEHDNVRMKIEEASQVCIGDIVERMDDFLVPDYDDTDRCEFCDGIKAEFAAAVKAAKVEQKERLWGLCLDCFKAGGLNAGACRYEHAKVQVKEASKPAPVEEEEAAQPVVQQPVVEHAPEKQQQQQAVGGLGIEGL